MEKDQEVLLLIKNGDESGMKYMYDQYYRYLCHAVYKVLGDGNTVEDIVQEVYYEIWRKRETLDIQISLKAYLRRAAINKSLNHIRNQKMKFTDDEHIKDRFIDDDDSHEKLEVAELQDVINESVSNLPEKCRIVFSMSRFESMSYKEIAAELSISVKTVENQISKALKVVRLSLARYNKLNQDVR